jgi:hypothetical protein
MPYEQYLSSASTSAYVGTTYTESTATGGVTATVIFDPPISATQTFYNSTGLRYTAVGGIYGFTASGTSFQSASGSYADPFTGQSGSNSAGQTASTEYRTSYGNESYSVSGMELRAEAGDGVDVNGNYGGQSALSSTTYSATASWNSDSSFFDGEGGITTTSSFYFYLNGPPNSGGTSGSSSFSPNLIGYYFGRITSITTLSVDLRNTTESTATFYGPLEASETTYTYIIETAVNHTFSSIKTLVNNKPFWDVEYQSKTFKIEWIGYSGGGAQNLGLVYTGTAVSKDISEYAKILMETDSFSSSNQRDIFSFGSAFTNENFQDSYTLTYDIITTSEVASQTTTLERASIGIINSFLYGFIKTNTADTTIYTAGTSTESVELVSSSQRFIYTYDTSVVAVSGASYSEVQAISTTSNFTRFVELSGLNKATSFVVRSFVTTTAPYTYRTNVYGITVDVGGNPDGRAYSFAPIFPQNALVIRYPENTNPDTFYTEKASVASFADPAYSTAYKGYSPADCSLVLVALVALNTEGSEGGADGNQYPSWISVYDGTFAGDRASTSNQSVIVSQSSSYVGTGATNVYQTISYFIGNNPDSQTTRTTSIAMALANSASSVSRLIRTAVENLDSAYINSYLPSIKLKASNVFFTQGLQGDASYNMDRLLLNAYTTAKSTFADSATSSFPISISTVYYLDKRNKIRIDSVYEEVDANSFNQGLLRYTIHQDL